MQITAETICGVSLGFEFLQDEEDGTKYYIIDLFIVRILAWTSPTEEL